MDTPESLNGMVADLIRRGLPADYAERAAAEFADHHRDLVEELQSTGFSESQAMTEASHRLGDSRKLAKKTVSEYRRRHWCGRWPLLTFMLAPIPAYIAAYAATGFSVIFIVYSMTKIGLTSSLDADEAFLTLPLGIKYAVLGTFTLVLPAIVLCGFNRLARRAALGGQWILVTACVLGVFIGMFRWERIGPNSKLIMHDRQTGDVLPQPRQPDFVILLPTEASTYFSLSGFCRWYMTPLQLSQLLLPTIAAASLLLHRRQLAIRAANLRATVC